MLTRDSVCAGDDCDAPHEKCIEIHSFVEPKAFVNHIATGYLPSIAGVGHSWDCELNGKIVAVVTVHGIVAKVFEIRYDQDNKVHFKYHMAAC